MKKNENNEVKEESTLMKLWHNKRTHAAMVLGLWMLFLGIVMLVAFIGGNSNETLPSIQETEEQKVEFRSYDMMQNDLLKGNYSYTYKLTYGENKVNFIGHKYDSYEEGYRESAVETIKYRIENDMFYQVIMDELSAFDKLYENIVENYIDVEYIFNEIKDKSVASEELENTRTFSYNYTLEETEYSVVVTTDLEKITKIDISFLDNHYELNYSEVSNAEIVPQEVN